MTIAHNMAVDRIRHDRGIGRPTLVLVDDVPEPNAAEDEDLVAERDLARRAMAGLSQAERNLLCQAYFFGWTAREIAEATNVPLGTVKTRLRTALIRLRAASADAARSAALTREAGSP